MFDKTCLNEVVEHPNAQNWDVLAIFEPGKQPEVSPMSEYLHAGEYSFVANIGNGPGLCAPRMPRQGLCKFLRGRCSLSNTASI